MALSALLGTLFVPSAAGASIFSTLLGSDAYADTSANGGATQNLQTLALLSAETISPVTNKKGPEEDAVFGEIGGTIVSDTALLAAATPASDGTGGPDFGNDASPADQISVYVVHKGDSLSQIADMFGVSTNTILWANDMKKGDALKEGDVLFILPITGIEHTVTKGQTVQTIAKLYKVDAEDIIRYNDLPAGAKLAVGDKLIVPNGEKAAENGKPVKNLAASIAKDENYYKTHPVKNLSGYFVNPVPGYRKSQGIHDNNGVDLAIATGTPIHAAAAGTVTLARIGYNGGYGNLVIIKHANGTETLYAHQSKIATTTGAHVAQGEVIGYVGSTGRSTGPHLHFEVHGARNPGADGSWAK